ncbi:hypothetical protein JRQ81_006191 [Phrynocephalus forsythii]|uniref:Kelch-like protein 36 n=1 Tax=Phrynocephalus forsythii TaxID=171643 RepID=A0A9Q1AUS0_9SAUR|nr:hypothetical protein JRQ81_006191 [Phrynocephalus forsythii]
MMEGTKQARISHPHSLSESSKVYRSADHASLILQSLNAQRQQGLFCDIVLVVEENKLPAHRNILAACSDYFNSMFTLGMREASQKEVELFGSSYLGLRAVMDFLYGGDLSLDSGNIEDILETAHLLQIGQVVNFCCEYLESEVNEENYLCLQELASLYHLERLDASIDAFVLRNFGTLSFTTGFLQNVSAQKLCQYLGSGEVQQEGEHRLFQAALQWLTQYPERKNEAYRVLENIHFPLIPKGDLLQRVKPDVCSLLKESPCEGLVEEAVRYHNNVAAQPVLQNKRTALRTCEEKLLFLGGEVSENCLELSDDTCFFNTKTGQWVRETLLPARQSHHCVAVLGGFIFIAGGSISLENGEDAASNLLYRYDPRCNQWIKLASMRPRRVDFFLAAVKDKLLAVGGRNDYGALSLVEIYSPAKDAWSYVADLPSFIYGHAGAVHNEFVYISGGHDSQIGPFRKNLLCYDHRTDRWEEKMPMITARSWHSMCTLGGHIYSIGGSHNYPETMTRFDILEVESYNPPCNQWTRVAPLLQANSESGVATWEGKIYILGGYSWEEMVFSRTVQVYNKDKNRWQKATDLPKAIAGVSACVCALKTQPEDKKKKATAKRHQERGR